MVDQAEESLEVSLSPSDDWQERLEHMTETMRRMSRYTDPAEMVYDYTARMADYLHYDRMLSLTRRGVDEPKFIVARDTDRVERLDPWLDREKLPRCQGGLLGELIHGVEARVFGAFNLRA